MEQVELPQPAEGLLGLAIMVAAAWFGGLGPAIVLCPLVLVLSRLSSGKSLSLNAQDWGAFIVISMVIVSVGLAGQYRRRFRQANRAHAKKLENQSRALSLAHIVFCDREGRVTEWNEGASRMFGWTSEEAVGRDLHELLKTQLPYPYAELEANLLETGQWKGEVIHRHKDGAELIVATHWILYRDEHGAPIGVAKIHNDVSELRRAEEAIREADRRKDEFLALLAHELRNPLAPIRMGLELMKHSLDDPELLEEVRMTMERQTRQLVTLVDDLLDVSRITRGKLELRKSRVSLQDAVQSAVEASRPFIAEAGHELSVAEVDSRIHLDADPHRLAQVFANLLNNAAKFTPKGGRVRITTEQEGSDVVVTIRDNGIGIPSEMRERIFEMFTQIGSSGGQVNSGLGIGLTLVKSLVEMHGGMIDVRSEGPMKGAAFSVRLPILVEAAHRASAPVIKPPQTSPGISRRVLVVDDNAAAVQLLSLVVKSLGNEVRTAGNGQEAIEVAAEFRPEVVVMDLGMPKMNGFDAARHIRREPWGQDMLLIALSGWGQEEDKRRTKEAGFDHHLTKPAEPAELRRLLGQGRRVLN